MITLHFHLQPQYKYDLFHIYFTWFHCTGRYELNKLTLLPVCGFIAQLVEHRTGIAEVMGSNPVEALIFFFRLLLSSCLNWKIYCDDHTSLSELFLLLRQTKYFIIFLLIGTVSGNLPSSALHAKLEALLFTSKKCLQNLRWIFSIAELSHFLKSCFSVHPPYLTVVA